MVWGVSPRSRPSVQSSGLSSAKRTARAALRIVRHLFARGVQCYALREHAHLVRGDAQYGVGTGAELCLLIVSVSI